MARFYASFDNSTKSALESDKFERKTYTDGSTLKTALINARAALSAGFYAVIEPGNRNGANGIVLPQGTFTNDGTNISFTNLYTNPNAVWPSNPQTRPTEPILASSPGSAPVSPTDGGAFTASLYTDAQTALGNALAGIADGGPNGRLGLNAWRTLASLWHDHDLTYFAWDDFTPGTPQSLQNTGNVVTGTATGGNGAVAMTFSWLKEYEADTLGTIEFSGDIIGPNVFTKPFSGIANASTGTITINVTDIDESGLFDIVGTATFYDSVIVSHAGTPATINFTDAFTIPLT